MSKRKPDSYVGETHASADPRDVGRQIRITDVADDGRLRYRTMIPSTVAPTTLVPRGRKGLISTEILGRDYRKLE